jgi:hypothetical protein
MANIVHHSDINCVNRSSTPKYYISPVETFIIGGKSSSELIPGNPLELLMDLFLSA